MQRQRNAQYNCKSNTLKAAVHLLVQTGAENSERSPAYWRLLEIPYCLVAKRGLFCPPRMATCLRWSLRRGVEESSSELACTLLRACTIFGAESAVKYRTFLIIEQRAPRTYLYTYVRTYVRVTYTLIFYFFLTVQINESHYTYTVDGKEDIRGANFKGLIIDSRLLA